MKTVLASVGIGNATVDTVLEDTTVRPGDSVDGEVRIEGGSAEQEVDHIELEIETRYRTDEGVARSTVDRAHLTDGFTIEPDEHTTYETTVDVPYATPLTLGDARVWVETDLEVPMAVDPEDRDPLDVEATDRMQAVFDAAESLGLTLRTADCEADPHGRYVGRRYVQEFEFYLSDGRYRGDLDELELVFAPSADALTVYVEIDRSGGLLSELSERDERKTSFSLEAADSGTAERELRDAIERHV